MQTGEKPFQNAGGTECVSTVARDQCVWAGPKSDHQCPGAVRGSDKEAGGGGVKTYMISKHLRDTRKCFSYDCGICEEWRSQWTSEIILQLL